MLTKSTKTTLDLVIPSIIAGGVAWYIFGRSKNWKFVLGGAVVAWILAYLIVSRLTKVAYAQGPAPVPTGGGCDGYQPQSLIDAIYEDCNCTFCFRDKALYDSLGGLADCQLIKAYNYWNEKYYTDSGVSLPILIANQSNAFDSNFEQQQKALKIKFATLNLQ